MWNELNEEAEVNAFLDKIWHFHDSCITEMKYKSGAYVNQDYAMHPINDCQNLRVVIQRQCSELSMIELEFIHLNWMRLFPVSQTYTCEIFSATIELRQDCVLWYNEDKLSEADLETFDGILICAEKLRWREIKNHMGSDDYWVENR